MNTKTILTFVTIAAALAVVMAPALMATTAFAAPPERDRDEGIGNEKNFGHCKQEKENDNACEGKFGKN